MRAIVETPQFRRAFRRFVRRNPALRQRIEQVLLDAEDREVIVLHNLGTHDEVY
jgi:mRNA-degrading endonuclease YafQ of YafQ-DinJ toxin-antitoxin module